jgi:hypothetical protein
MRGREKGVEKRMSRKRVSCGKSQKFPSSKKTFFDAIFFS